MNSRRVITKAAWIALAAVFMIGGVAATARADESVVVKVPFAFIVGDRQLPAGEYVVKEMTDDGSVVLISSDDGRQNMVTLTIPSEARGATPRASLVFEKFENHYFLSGLVPQEGNEREIVLTPARMEHELHVLAAD
jgi:hypothetical protein